MQRREMRSSFERLQNLRRDALMRGQRWAAVNDAMADAFEFRKIQLR